MPRLRRGNGVAANCSKIDCNPVVIHRLHKPLYGPSHHVCIEQFLHISTHKVENIIHVNANIQYFCSRCCGSLLCLSSWWRGSRTTPISLLKLMWIFQATPQYITWSRSILHLHQYFFQIIHVTVRRKHFWYSENNASSAKTHKTTCIPPAALM